MKCAGPLLAVKWHDKCDVHVLSTISSASMADSGKVDFDTGEHKMKPSCVLDYNKNMGAVDRFNMRNSSVECTRKTMKWYKKIFFHLVDCAIHNAYYTLFTNKSLARPFVPRRSGRTLSGNFWSSTTLQGMPPLAADHHWTLLSVSKHTIFPQRSHRRLLKGTAHEGTVECAFTAREDPGRGSSRVSSVLPVTQHCVQCYALESFTP